jgi:hypothetical protein
MKHGRRHTSTGEDPIPGLGGGPISALGIAASRSQSCTGNLPLEFDYFYSNDASFGYEQVTSSRARYITITTEGWYKVQCLIDWDTDWTAGDYPYIEPSCYVGGAPDTLVGASATYWQDAGGIIYGQQLIAVEHDHHSIACTVYFNFDATDFGNDTTIGLGINMRSSATRTKTFGGQIAITRLGDLLTETTIT